MALLESIIFFFSHTNSIISQARGNFFQVSRTVLKKIPAQQPRMSYVYDKYVFHYISVDGLVFMCMSDESMQRRLCFAFLEGMYHLMLLCVSFVLLVQRAWRCFRN